MRSDTAQGRCPRRCGSGSAEIHRIPDVVKKILVVDDSETVRQRVRQALVPAGYDIVEAVDGLDGLEKMRTVPDLSLVLCDVNMPGMTGLEMMAQVNGEGITTPVIMLTSEGQPSLIRWARESGAKGWIVKPFKVDLLVVTVNRVTSPPASGR
jgi:two-component system, chemotaxis family, chemotaxis protein CheY